MKFYRNAVILVVVFGLLFGGYMYISKKKGPDESKTDDGNVIKIVDINKDKLSEIDIDNKGEKLVLSNKGNWVLTSPSGIKFDKTKLDNVASAVSAINGDKVIEENATDLKQYGFNASYQVTLKLSDGTVKGFELGSQTPTKEGYYIKLKDSNKVYTVADYYAETLIVGKNDLKDKNLFAISRDAISGFKMEKAGAPVVETVKKSSTTWDITVPFDAAADPSKLDSIFSAVLGLNVNSFVEDNASDLSKYGLNNPSYAFEIDTTGGNVKILLGDEKVKGSEMYAKMDNSSDVFTVDESALNFLDKPLKEMVDSFVYIVDISDVSKIDVDFEGNHDSMTIEAEKGKSKEDDKFTFNGKDLTNVKDGDKVGPGMFRVYYQGLIGVSMSELDTASKPSGKPEITFTYSLRTAPGVMKVEFIPKDDKYYYALKNGKYTNILVEKKQFDELRNARKALTDAIAKSK